MEQERRLRREIANSNERRRMQSINAGFQSLRTLLPHHEGEKLSKAAILQQTAEYIYQLEQEKTRLLSQNCHLKRLVQQHQHLNADSDGGESPLPKRKKGDASPGGHLTEITDEGLGSMSPDRSSDEPSLDDLKSDLIELRLQLERERGLRKLIEEQLRSLKTQICSSKIREVPSQVHGQMKKSLDHCDPHFSDSVIKSEPLGTDPSDGCLATVTIPCLVETGNIASDDSSSNSSCITGSQSITATATVSSVGGDCMIPEIPEERVPSTTEFTINEESGPRTIYVTNTSRQNLETIVEAIRHLEGDHLFGDDGVGREEVIEIETQDMPLELTAKSTSDTAVSCLAPGEMDCYKTELHGSESSRHVLCAPLLSNRPGVIVVKHQL